MIANMKIKNIIVLALLSLTTLKVQASGAFVKSENIASNTDAIELLLEKIPVSDHNDVSFFRCKSGSDTERIDDFDRVGKYREVMFREVRSADIDIYACSKTIQALQARNRECLKFKLNRKEDKILEIETYNERFEFDISEQKTASRIIAQVNCIIDYSHATDTSDSSNRIAP